LLLFAGAENEGEERALRLLLLLLRLSINVTPRAISIAPRTISLCVIAFVTCRGASICGGI